MKKEILHAKRGTYLRKNGPKTLEILIKRKDLKNIFLIIGTAFITENISESDLNVDPDEYYMIINNKNGEIEIHYNHDISNHEIIYNPYKFENSEKINFEPELFIEKYKIPSGYIDTLPKWYSFKFTYPNYNMIFIRPELGISIQKHEYRTEYWEIIDGKPIIINGNTVHYFVEKGTKFQSTINTYHSVINPNKDKDKFVVLKEKWSGKFDENDIERVYNPNHYR